ncbi:MAG: anthranilate phosphoribosyltransferase [Alphaproteobacteria bacterium 65-7]|nr:MAG: anthranilate phosphoribosyltransferase [Alphaproteobacteria bacterium 65-7]
MTDFSAVAETPLDAGQTERLFDRIFGGELAEAEIVSYLTATAERRPTVDEVVGAVRSMRRHMRAVAAPDGAIDLCGTGGDGHGTLNISTAVSFVAAGAGVPVAKHGNRSASSKSGAADILEAMGVNLTLEPDAAARVLARTGIVFLFAQVHHPAMRHVAAARRQIGRRTIFNLLGPLASPARVTRQLVGIFGREWLTPYAEALRDLGSRRALVVHGADGLDELTTTDVTFFASLDDGAITHGEIAPEDAGLSRAGLADIKGGDAAYNAEALRRLFDGASGPYRDIVLLNAGAALLVAGAAKDVKDGVALAAQSLDSGAAAGKLEALIEASNDD